MVGTLPRLWFWLDPSPSYTSHWYSSGENRDRVSDPMLVYGHSSLSLYGLCTLFDLPLQYAYFSSRFNPPLFPSFWKFSPLSYSEMRFRGFCSTNTFENRGSSPHCGSETSFLYILPLIDLSKEEGTTELPFQADRGAKKPHNTGSGACRLF